MFTSVIDTSSGSVSVESALLCTGAALILGMLIAVVYMVDNHYTKNFVITLALLPALVQIVILIVNGNLGASVAVLGTFSLVRFRSAPGTSKEIMNVFFAMAVGLACGMGQLVFAAIVTVIISLAMLILTKSRFGEKRGDWKHLKIVIPENLDYHIILKDVRKEKEMIDEIRCRNGNLSITCGRRVQDGLEL